ncbi:MAG: beta-propeller fold lactonase family protein [Candidatus Sulfotelmatobacter sp.]
MRILISFWRPRYAAVLIWICVLNGLADGATQPRYLLTNDDAILSNSSTFYSIGPDGLLHLDQQVLTGGVGIAGGYFSTERVALLDDTTQQCVYASDAFTGDIVGINMNTFTVGGSASGSPTDSGNANGIGLAANDQYLYAGFTTSNTIATFQVEPGCSLTFVNDISVAGLQGGFIGGMALHGNIMVVTYGDGSIESFDISSGTPVSNGDEQNSTGYSKSQGASYPDSVEITKDGRYALFGDTSTSMVVEVSEIGPGRLGKTSVYTLGPAINSSNILLSPDESLLYISNTEGDTISAAFFDSSTGKLSAGCTSGTLRGYGPSWSYAGELAVGSNTGTGGIIYVAEFGPTSSIGMIAVGSNGAACTLNEMSQSPVSDANSPGLLSIGSFPPRSF